LDLRVAKEGLALAQNELRVTVRLARCSRAKPSEEAHAVLTEIYNWFTEGFDTCDLQEAQSAAR
jgi:hypothetical protein